MALLRVFFLFSVGCLLAGCQSFTRLDDRLAAQIPAQWTAIEVPEGSVTGWLDDFSQASFLRSLVEEAVGRNYESATARERVTQALARARQSGANLLPEMSGSLAGSRSQRLRAVANS